MALEDRLEPVSDTEARKVLFNYLDTQLSQYSKPEQETLRFYAAQLIEAHFKIINGIRGDIYEDPIEEHNHWARSYLQAREGYNHDVVG